MPFAKRRDGASRPWRLSAKLLIVFALVTVIGFSAICVSVMLEMRRGEEELARQALENLASSIDADIGRNVELTICRCVMSPPTCSCRRSIRSAGRSGN
jgi:hypothetical protein